MRRYRPEQDIQRAVFEHLAVRVACNCFAFHVPNGGARSPVEAAIMKGIGVKAGIPDIVAVRDGRFFGLELKTPNGHLTAAQRDAHAALAAAGATVAVAYGLDGALAALEGWKLLRGGSDHG
jgi:VRR-NUC domain-containing protein